MRPRWLPLVLTALMLPFKISRLTVDSEICKYIADDKDRGCSPPSITEFSPPENLGVPLLRLLRHGSVHRLSEGLGTGSVAAHPVALTLDVEDHAAMKQTVEHRRSHHGVIEDLPPGGDAEIGGENRGTLQVALGDNLEERGCGFLRSTKAKRALKA